MKCVIFFIMFLSLLSFVMNAQLLNKITGRKCSSDEEYKQCGTACPPTCEKPLEEICLFVCEEGCFCKSGLVRNSNNKCVTVDQCSLH